MVTSAKMRAGRGSVMGPDNNRRIRWWEMVLECGHLAERSVKYGPTVWRMQQRNHSDALPAPTRVRCGECPATGNGTPPHVLSL